MSMIKCIKKIKCHNGFVEYYTHDSVSTQTEMTFSVFLPEKIKTEKVPFLVWLSGLTCTHENFIEKAAAQKYANEAGIMLVCPDTSPRGTDIEGEHDDWDFGSGAGFYVNATTDLWKKNYNMYDYIVDELLQIVENNFSVNMNQLGIFGHSMGGHGALVMALRNPDIFKSVSAFSPICAPMQCPWGEKAFSNYLGKDKQLWKQYDTSELIKSHSKHIPMLVDQGTDDQFLEEQLKTHILQDVCKESNYAAEIRLQEGYDHSYYFITTFIEDHISFHKQYLS